MIVADRATWAAWTASRLDDHDPLHLCALLNPGFPLGSVTPFTGVTAVGPSTTLRCSTGRCTRRTAALASGGAAAAMPAAGRPGRAAAGVQGSGPGRPGARDVAEGLVAAVAPLRDAGSPVELSLTGGKDSRLIAAALVKAGVPVVARTHGFDDHPDVVVAAEIARRLGIEHVVRTPAAPGAAGRRARQDPRHRARRRRDAVRVRERRPPRPRRLPGAHRGRSRRRAAARRLRRDGGPPGAPAGCARVLRPCPPRRSLRRAAAPPHHEAPRPDPPGARRRLRRLAGPVDAAARPPPDAGPRRLLPGQPRGPVVGGRPAGLPAARAPGPAAVRRPRGARRPRRPAGRPGERRALAPPSSPSCPRPWRTFPWPASRPRARSPPSTGAASTATRSRRSCAATSSTWAPPAACSTW